MPFINQLEYILMLSFINNSVKSALAINNIQDEVESLLDAARNEIALFDAMEEWLANNLASLYTVVQGAVVVKHINR